MDNLETLATLGRRDT